MSVPVVILSLIILSAIVALWTKNRKFQALLREREKIEGEEYRMFDFLHGLGDALQTDSSPPNMNRYIVEGVIRVVAASGGCLYLLDKSGEQLVPVFKSKDCPPFIEVPRKVTEHTGDKDTSLDSYLRLQSIPRGGGLLGACLSSHSAKKLVDLSAHPAFVDSPGRILQNGVPAMVAPLLYGGTDLGLIAVAGAPRGEAFSENDFDVFKSVAEQSSFALGSALIHREAHEKKQLESEIRNASEIQKILLPFAPPTLEDFIISAVNYPAKIVSGDYYDYIRVDDNHYGVVIGDVSGKGIPASLIMAMCRSVVRVKAAGTLAPSEVLDSVNRVLFPDIREDMFISIAYVLLEKNSNQITLVRAGHDPPLLYRKHDNSIEKLTPPGLGVGIDGGDVFARVTRDYTFTMESGDTLLLYTDGATEATDANGNEFGLDPLSEALKATAAGGARAVLDRISTEVRDFLANTRQNDDITLIAIEKR